MQARSLCVLAFCLFASASAESEKGAKEALEKALSSIEVRIQDTAAADQALQTEIQTNCTRDLATLDQRIATKASEIAAKEKQIADTEAAIEVLESTIESLEAQLVTNRDAKATKENEVVQGDKQRAEEAATYKQYDSDTQVAIEAVIEVQGIVADSKLGAGASDSAEDFANTTLRSTNQDDYAAAGLSFLSLKTSTLLKKLSHRVQDPNVKSFIEMAALSAEAMKDGAVGDVSRLNELLAQLVTELKQYKADLKTAELQAIEDWKNARAALIDVIADLTATIARLDGELTVAQGQLAQKETELAQQQTDLAGLKKEKADFEAQRVALDKLCKDEQQEFLDRKERRDEEQTTLASIRKVIEEKLDGMSDHSDANLAYTAATGFRWVVGTYDGVACIDRVQEKPHWCIESATNTKQDDTLLCGPSPKNMRRSCRNEKPKDDY